VDIRAPASDVKISFVIPAHNEETLIGQSIRSVVESAEAVGCAVYEVIVVDDASTDRTAEIAASFGVRVVSVNHRQISATRNAGAKAARGRVLVFVDADTQVRPAVLRAALHVVSRGYVGGGSCIEIERPLPLYGVLIERAVQMVAPAVGLAGGCFFFCTRDAFEAVGGFDSRLFAAEEVALARALSRVGQFIVLRQTVLTSGRKLRAHSAMDMLRVGLRIVRTGQSALETREGLDFWYGPREIGKAQESIPGRGTPE
jgi:glycosyltransferase involved in cell wall biosynthesis